VTPRRVRRRGARRAGSGRAAIGVVAGGAGSALEMLADGVVEVEEVGEVDGVGELDADAVESFVDVDAVDDGA